MADTEYESDGQGELGSCESPRHAVEEEFQPIMKYFLVNLINYRHSVEEIGFFSPGQTNEQTALVIGSYIDCSSAVIDLRVRQYR